MKIFAHFDDVQLHLRHFCKSFNNKQQIGFQRISFVFEEYRLFTIDAIAENE